MTFGEVISTGQVGAIYGSRCGGQITVGEEGREAYLSAGTKLFIDRNFNHNQQINLASVLYGISKLVVTKVYCQ